MTAFQGNNSVTMKAIQMKVKTTVEGELIPSEEDFSCKHSGREIETDEAHFEGETMLVHSPSEASAKACSSKADITIKPCNVLLKNIDCELKGSHQHGLISPKTKKLPQTIRKTKKLVSFKTLQAGLFDLLDRHRMKMQRNLPNPATLPENKKVNKMESGLERNSSAEVVSKGTNTDHDIKAEREASFPDSSTLCDNIFAKFSFIKSNLENSSAGFCPYQGHEKGAECLWEDSKLIPDPETQNTVPFEPIKKCMEHGEIIEQTERKESSHGTDTLASKCSLETSTDSTGPSSRINMPISPGETLQIPKTNTAHSSVLSLACEPEPYLVSLLPGNALKLDLKDEFPRKSSIKVLEEGTSQHSIQSSTEGVIQEQVTVEELHALHKTRPLPRKEDYNYNSCWFKLERDEVMHARDPTYEENISQNIQNGNHSSDVPPSGCQSFPGDAKNTKHGEVRKETVLNGREISSAEECGTSQPAKEHLAGKLSGSTVQLLGTPRKSSQMLALDRLTELEESSDSVVQTGSRSAEESQGHSPSLNEENEGSPYSTEVTWHQPLYSDDTRAMNRSTQRSNRRLTLIHSSKLSQEESRVKVVDSLREVLQKRLDDSPDLSVQEDAVLKIAKKVEKALFNLSCCVDQQYKNKYRSLLFNLKSAKNQLLFCKVIRGEISPKRLVQMNALELAPEDLAEWRAKERKHALEVIEKEEREAPRGCPTKFTHKGIIEIQRETDEDLMYQEIFGSQSLDGENSHLEASADSVRYTRDNHKSLVSDFDSFSDAGQMAAGSEGGFKPPTDKHILKQKTNVSKCLQSLSVYSGGGEKQLPEDRSICTASAIVPKKSRVGNQTKTSVIWTGLIQMFSLKQFAAKGYPVSGVSYQLLQALPDLLQSRGCILPEDVWAYLDSIWPAHTKEMALIRFHPSLTNSHSPYSMLYSYLNNKHRYGIVDSDRMEIFMVPLAAYQPVPSKLRPLGGPGLDQWHPSLLLGLILPKRPPARPPPLPNTKRKSVTFKDNIETHYFPAPSQVDSHQMQPPQPLAISGPLLGCDCPVAVVPRHEPLLGEDLGSETVHGGLSSLHHETAGGGTSQSLSDVILQLQHDSPWMEGQLGSLTLEALGAQSQQAGICTDPDALRTGDSLGLLLPSETVCPNHCGVDGAPGANLLDTSLLLSVLYPEAVPPAKESEAPSLLQIPSATPVGGDTNSLVEEVLSLIQYVTQLQSQTTPNQEPHPSLPVMMPPETASMLSSAVAGLQLPAVQQSNDDMYAQIQLLLSSFGGQTQPPAL